jgi:hypothetical protein
MNPEIFIIAGGFYHLSWAVFHMFFPKVFEWETALKNIGFLNQSLMHIQSIFLLITFLIFSFAAFVFPDELIKTNLGRYFIASFCLFWLIRSIVQIYYFGIKNKKANLFHIIFIFGFLIHLIPLIIVLL